MRPRRRHLHMRVMTMTFSWFVTMLSNNCLVTTLRHAVKSLSMTVNIKKCVNCVGIIHCNLTCCQNVYSETFRRSPAETGRLLRLSQDISSLMNCRTLQNPSLIAHPHIPNICSSVFVFKCLDRQRVTSFEVFGGSLQVFEPRQGAFHALSALDNITH